MNATRRARLASVVLEELAVVVPREVKDPRVSMLTFTHADVAEDGSHVTLSVALLDASTESDDERYNARVRDCIEGLNSAAGFLRRSIARVLTVRHVPTLSFREDRGLRNVARVHELLQQIHKSEN